MLQPRACDQEQHENNYEPLFGPGQDEKFQETIHTIA
jgi:hypothetical protein